MQEDKRQFRRTVNRYAKSLHWAMHFRDQSNADKDTDPTWRTMLRGMMRSNARNAVYYLKQMDAQANRAYEH